jgi:hypothetical protein
VAPGISRCQNTSDSRMSSLGKIDRTRTLAFSRDLPLLHSLSHGPASLCSSIPSRREELRRRPSSGESVAPLLLPSRPSLLPHRQICLYFCRPLFFPRCRRSASQLLLLHFPPCSGQWRMTPTNRRRWRFANKSSDAQAIDLARRQRVVCGGGQGDAAQARDVGGGAGVLLLGGECLAFVEEGFVEAGGVGDECLAFCCSGALS